MRNRQKIPMADYSTADIFILGILACGSVGIIIWIALRKD